MRKILVGILVSSSLALATSAAFADQESHGLGGRIVTQPPLQVTTADITSATSAVDPDTVVHSDSPILIAHGNGDIENR